MNKILNTVTAIALSFAAHGALADSVTVDAETTVTATALQVSTSGTLNFGSFEITNAAATGTIRMRGSSQPDAQLTGAVYNGGYSRAHVNVTGTGDAPLTVTCSTSATLAHDTDSSNVMSVSDVTFNGVPCTGAISTVIGTDGTNEFEVLGTLNVENPKVGAYSTANAGGTPITVDIVYQ